MEQTLTYFYYKEGPPLYALQYLVQIVKDIPKMAGDWEDSCGRIPRKTKEFCKASCTHGDLNPSTHYGPINVHTQNKYNFLPMAHFPGSQAQGGIWPQRNYSKRETATTNPWILEEDNLSSTHPLKQQLYCSVRKTSQQTFAAPDIKLQ